MASSGRSPSDIDICEHLLEKPNLYQDEMAVFLWDEFEVLITNFSIGRALVSIGWTKKAARRVAKGRNADLRDFYLHNLSAFRSYHLVYVDESGCDKRIGFRRTGWSPLGVTPTQVAQFQHEQRYQILPAYAQDGVVIVRRRGEGAELEFMLVSRPIRRDSEE